MRLPRRAALIACALLLGSALSAQAQPAAVSPRVVLVVTIKAKLGQEAQFEAAFRDFVRKVRDSGLAQEFQLTRTATPGSYKLVEMFKDEAALAAHRALPHTKAFGATFGEFLDGPAQVEQLAAVD
jgi:quinol monooxygenase YgiN